MKAPVTVIPVLVWVRTTEVSSLSILLARYRSTSTDTTSSAVRHPATASAVAVAWANGLVTTPSTTG